MLSFVGSLSSLPILHSRHFFRLGSSNVQYFAHEHTVNPITLFYRKILAGILLSEMKTSRFFTFTVFMWNVLTWKLVVVAFASKIFLSNTTRSDGCGPQDCSSGTADLRCFKFLIRQLVTLNKTKIICSVTAREPFVACGVKISPLIGYNTNIPDIFQVFMLL